MNITRTYSVGDKGRARRLTNLSGAWVDISPITNLVVNSQPAAFYDVETDITDPNKVYIVGQTAPQGVGVENFYGIAVSNDAGDTWNQPFDLLGGDYSTLYFAPTPPTPFFKFHEVSVVDADTIYVCGDDGWVVKSIDGGQSFNKCTQLPTVIRWVGDPLGPLQYPVTSIHFITPLIGVVGCSGNAFKTINGGATWTHLNGGLPFAASSIAYRGICTGNFISQDQQTIVCLNYHPGLASSIFTSTNGGLTFTNVFTWLSETSGIHLTWTDDLHLWGFAENIARAHSIDGGLTWSYLQLPVYLTKSDYAGHFYDNSNGFYSEGTVVYRTTDGAVTQVLSETAPYTVTALWTKSVTTCYIVTDCTGAQEPFVTNSDLANYVGMTLQTCIDVPSLVKQVVNPPAPTNITMCYKLTDCCDPTHVTLVRQPPSTTIPPIASINGFIITFPLVYPGICWNVVEEICQNNPTPIDPILGTWWEGVYSVYNNCLSCTAAINNPCAVPTDLYTFTNCCDNTIQLYIGVEHIIGYPFAYAGLVVQIPSVPELGNNCWYVEKGTQGPATIIVNPVIDSVLSYADCASSPCTCVTNWPNGCYCVTITETDDCTGSAPWVGTIGEVFEDCPSCVGLCYLLTDCEGILDSIQTSTNLSAYLGDIIQIDNCDTCWSVDILSPISTCCWDLPVLVTISREIIINGLGYLIPTPGNALTYLNSLNLGVFTVTNINPELNRLCVTGNETYGDVTLTGIQQSVIISPTCNTAYPACTDSTCIGLVTANFATCEECNPPPLPTPFELHVRKVKPGYDTPGCSPEYTEKVLCTFAEGVFDQMAVKRYGITVCCDIDVDKWDIKRQLLELSAIYDPSLCVCLLPVPVPVCYPIEVPCTCTTITILSGSGTFTYIDCDGISQFVTFDTFNHGYICSKTAPILTSNPTKVTYTITNTNIECTTDKFCIVPPPICYCWEITTPGKCLYNYRDCDGVNQQAGLNSGINYLCSITEPTQAIPALCKPSTVVNLGTCADIPICSQIPCYCWIVELSGPCTYDYLDCSGILLQANFGAGNNYICSQVIPTQTVGQICEIPLVINNLGLCGEVTCAPPCECYTVVVNGTDADISYVNCDGIVINVTLPHNTDQTPYYICSRTIPIGTATITDIGSCSGLAECNTVHTCSYWVIIPGNTEGNLYYTNCYGQPGTTISITIGMPPFTICAQSVDTIPSGTLYYNTNISCVV